MHSGRRESPSGISTSARYPIVFSIVFGQIFARKARKHAKYAITSREFSRRASTPFFNVESANQSAAFSEPKRPTVRGEIASTFTAMMKH